MGIFDKLSATTKPPPPPPYNHTNTTNTSNPYPPTTSNTNYQQSSSTTTTPMSYNAATPSIETSANSGQRPLPPGWEKQWHPGYQRFFYVDTSAPSGPQSHWIHPLDQPGGSVNPPNTQPIRTAASNYPPPHPSGPQQSYQPHQQSYLPQQPVHQQPFYQQQQGPIQAPNNRRPGGVNPLLAGAGGLAGGMLLGSILESHHHHHDNYTDGYQQGYENGYENGFDNGDDYGGGVGWGGGDDFGGGGDFF